jgi:hypothetical protein
MSIEKYNHHGLEVSVDSELKGKHRDHCLCYKCEFFKPEDRGNNCEIANQLYKLCVMFYLVTPVYECPAFKMKENNEN